MSTEIAPEMTGLEKLDVVRRMMAVDSEEFIEIERTSRYTESIELIGIFRKELDKISPKWWESWFHMSSYEKRKEKILTRMIVKESVDKIMKEYEGVYEALLNALPRLEALKEQVLVHIAFITAVIEMLYRERAELQRVRDVSPDDEYTVQQLYWIDRGIKDAADQLITSQQQMLACKMNAMNYREQSRAISREAQTLRSQVAVQASFLMGEQNLIDAIRARTEAIKAEILAAELADRKPLTITTEK